MTNTNDIATATAKPKKPQKRKLLHKFFDVTRERESKMFEFMMGPGYDTASAIDDILWLKDDSKTYRGRARTFLDSLDTFGEYMLEVSMTDKSTPEEIKKAKLYYQQNKLKIKREKEKKAKDAAKKKKAEILAKSDRTPVTAKKKRRNRKSLHHTNEQTYQVPISDHPQMIITAKRSVLNHKKLGEIKETSGNKLPNVTNAQAAVDKLYKTKQTREQSPMSSIKPGKFAIPCL